MMTIHYDPNRHYQLNATLLVFGVIFGLIFGFVSHSAVPMLLLPVLSQYKWLGDVAKRQLFPTHIAALERLTNSAGLADSRDNYSNGRYRAVVHYTLKMDADHDVLTIDANGISNSRHIANLASDVGAAFHHPAYLLSVSNGIAVYRIEKSKEIRHVNENDF